ncbi:MAG: hypothetical protein EOS81_04580 [Mesorhizobium sp.]|uniref:hypothetical protein n=2 Tax=Mesorhizobium sp. TaxID=1871066 RepID=UPI000FD26A0A|nr:hypothetical protein EN759_02505 [Mesorhizobium sp. M00.F.Ca.ET.038.03.1.1]RWF05365.1 MAG: hypothetical protein EOS81_04580 [Mesorhizobium sp.]
MPERKQRTVYVVGAGLSAGLGFPTIANLLPDLWPRLEKAGIDAEIADVIRFHHPDFNAERRETYPTIEQLLSEMRANADLFESTRPAMGNFTSDKLEDRRAKLLLEMAGWFHSLKTSALRSKPSWLQRLATAMQDQQASIISFNWDLVLDDLLFGESLDKGSYGLDRRRRGPRLIKPHGSLNWYRSDTAGPLAPEKKFSLAGSGAAEVFAFRPLREVLSKSGRQYMPLIVPPVYMKQFEGPLFQRLWQETVQVLSTASEVRFLGFSLAEADFHARFVLRCGFYNQEHGALRSDARRDAATGRAKVVVVDRSRAPLARIRATVGWECEFHEKEISAWITDGGLGPG